MWIDIRIFDSIPLVLLFVFMSVAGCFYYDSYVVEFEVRYYDASRSSFIVHDCFDYFGFLFYHMKLNIVLSRSVKNFAGHCIESVVCFCKIAIFTMLILPTKEHGKWFHFLVFSSIYFFKDLKFLSFWSFISLVRVSSRYFVLFVSIVKRDVYLISFSAHLSSV